MDLTSIAKALNGRIMVDFINGRKPRRPIFLKSEVEINGIKCYLVVVKVAEDMSALTNKGWVMLNEVLTKEEDILLLANAISLSE